jgi:hypothetical protein
VSPNTKLRRTLALALAGGSLAIGVPAALAAGGSDSGTNSDSGAPASGFVQDEQAPQNRPNGEGQQNRPGGDCPEHDGTQGDGAQGDGAGSGSSGSSDSGTSTPEV